MFKLLGNVPTMYFMPTYIWVNLWYLLCPRQSFLVLHIGLINGEIKSGYNNNLLETKGSNAMLGDQLIPKLV